MKTISFIIAISIAFATVSCLDTVEPEAERTPELEASELAEFLSNIEAQGLDIDTTDLGIYYVMQVLGSDTLPQTGDTVYLEYTGFLIDGTVFDTSHDHYIDGIWDLIFRDIQLIPGFDDGIALMGKGAELDMIVPSYLAYGAYGSGQIPPYSTIVFTAKMHDIKPKGD